MANSTSDKQRRPDENIQTIEWSLWFQWLLATTLGWLLGILIGEIGVGVVVGIGQWLVLRQRIHQAGWWVWASTVGWAVGWALIVTGVVISPEARSYRLACGWSCVGVMLGIAQWLVLRRMVHYAGWWVLANAIGWAIGLTGILGATVVGAVVGAVTGFALDFLLRYPRTELPNS